MATTKTTLPADALASATERLRLATQEAAEAKQALLANLAILHPPIDEWSTFPPSEAPLDARGILSGPRPAPVAPAAPPPRRRYDADEVLEAKFNQTTIQVRHDKAQLSLNARRRRIPRRVWRPSRRRCGRRSLHCWRATEVCWRMWSP